MLSKGFLPVNLNLPGLRVQNIDPPVLTVEQFIPDEVCDALREAAKASGKMKTSGVGGTGDLKDDIRTSSTLAITKEVRQRKHSRMVCNTQAALFTRSCW
jgi:collagen type III alpha